MLQQVKRKISQLLLTIFLLFPFSYPFATGQIRWFCTPVMNCHGCAWAHFVCPIGIIAKYPSSYFTFPFVALGIILIVGALFGRALCGWACPIGFLQDLLYKIPTPKFKIPQWMGYGKYFALIVLVLILPIFSEYFYCNVFCVTAGTQITIPNLIMGTQKIAIVALPQFPSIYLPAITIPATETSEQIVLWHTTVRFMVTIIFLTLIIFTSRFFCKVFCPIGAALALFNYFSFIKIKQPSRCISCQKCNKACPVDCKPMERISKGINANCSGECIVCNQCNNVCPMIAKDKKDAIQKKQTTTTEPK